MTKPNIILYIIIGILAVWLVLSRCGGHVVVSKSDTSYNHFVKVDTTHKDSIIFYPKYVPVLTSVKSPSKETLDSLVKTDSSYKQEYFGYNTYKDTIKLDSFGSSLTLTDVINKNKLISRSPVFKDARQIITIHDSTVTQITKTNPPKRQVYLGGEITGTPTQLINGVNAILLYKDRQDRSFLIKGGLLNVNDKVIPLVGAGMLIKL